MYNTADFGKIFLPERFSAPFTKLHDQIFELLDNDYPRVVIAAPRGIGKTSCCIAKCAQSILFSLRKFIIYVSVSHDGAVQQTENLKRDLTASKEIKELFGTIKTRSDTLLEESFSKKSWVGLNTLVYPKGSGQQIRGSLYGNARPDLFIIDDLEDPDTMGNETLVQRRKEWFAADLMKATSRLEKNWKIVYIDTLKSSNSLLQDLLDSPDWEGVRLEICDDNYEPTVPEFFSKEDIMREVAYHRSMNMLDVFYREFRNLPISKENASFKEEYFKTYNDPEDLKDKQIENVVLVDPAKTAKIQSADTAIVGVGLDRKEGGIYIRDIKADKLYPDEIYDETFKMADRIGARVIGVEETSLCEFIKQPFLNEMHKRGKFYDFVWLNPRGGAFTEAGKAGRVSALIPYYRMGHIYHNANVCQGLEAQLLGYPRPHRWDIMDALAYVIELFERGDRYFMMNDFDGEDLEAEYADLENEAPLLNWRQF